MLRTKPLICLPVLSLVLAGCAALPSYTGTDSQLPVVSAVEAAQPLTETITVTGFGRASGQPDMAIVSLVVESRAAAISEAADTSAQIITRVIEALRTKGVADADIQSTGINIWREDIYDFDTGRPTGQQLFHADRTLTVTIHGVDRVASVIQAALDAGATNVYGFSYGIEDRAELEADARAMAITDAADRAQQLATAMGVSLGDPVIASETAGGGLLLLNQAGLATGLGGGGGSGQEFNPGSLDVSVQVDLVYTYQR